MKTKKQLLDEKKESILRRKNNGGRKEGELPKLSIIKGGAIRQEVFDVILKEELQNNIDFGQENLTLIQVRAIKKAYTRALKSVLTYASYFDTESGIYYNRKLTNSIIRKAPGAKESTLSVMRPEIKVRTSLVDKDIVNFNGTLDEEDENIFILEDGTRINITELEDKLMDDNFELKDEIALGGIVIADKETKEYRGLDEMPLYTTIGEEASKEKVVIKNDLEKEHMELLNDYAELIELLDKKVKADETTEEKEPKKKVAKKTTKEAPKKKVTKKVDVEVEEDIEEVEEEAPKKKVAKKRKLVVEPNDEEPVEETPKKKVIKKVEEVEDEAEEDDIDDFFDADIEDIDDMEIDDFFDDLDL